MVCMMCKCLYIYIYICMYFIYMYYICMYVLMNICIYVCIYVLICMCACMYKCMYVCICMKECMYVCKYACINACMYIYMYVCSAVSKLSQPWDGSGQNTWEKSAGRMNASCPRIGLIVRRLGDLIAIFFNPFLPDCKATFFPRFFYIFLCSFLIFKT